MRSHRTASRLRRSDRATRTPMQALINFDLIRRALMRDAPWAGSHGAEGDYLGMGLLYYALVYGMRAKVAVCLGSGGGFVPRLMRQAQRDLGVAHRSRDRKSVGQANRANRRRPL